MSNLQRLTVLARRIAERRLMPGRVRGWALRAAWWLLAEDLGIWSPVQPDRWPRKGYDHEVAAREAIQQVVGWTQLSYERLVTLYEHVLYVERAQLPGALVECGVWRGGAVGIMALANLAAGVERRPLHLFDSFLGMPEPRVEVDGERAVELVGGRGAGSLVSTGFNEARADEARDLLVERIGYPRSFVFMHPGWFQDTLPHAREQTGPIAVLRLDADWYESTMVALEHLYPLVVPGGIVVIDDYGEFEGCRRATEEYLAVHEPNVYLHYVDLSGRYFIKPASSPQS